MNSTEKGPGRPKKDNDPSRTAPLFEGNNVASDLFSDTYDENELLDQLEGEYTDGPVLGGGAGFTLEDRMQACARLARAGKTESVRLQAIIKYSELERQLKVEEGGEDLGEEMAAFLAMVREKTPGEMVGYL